MSRGTHSTAVPLPLYREGLREHYEIMAGRLVFVRSSVCLSVCRVPPPNSTTERPRNPKIGIMDWKQYSTEQYSTEG